jgi:hypothetical protein
MNYSDLITMVVLIVVPAVAAWWWIQKTNDRNSQGFGRVSPGDAGTTKRDDPK